jgi:hypothetical protein
VGKKEEGEKRGCEERGGRGGERRREEGEEGEERTADIISNF